MIIMFTQIEISLLARLLIAHLLTDFVFQSDSWVELRRKNGWYSKHLYLHGIVAGLLAYLFSGLWRKDISEKEGAEKDKSLEKAGTWIGWLERFLILTFILLQQYAAIGFLVAAKSIFRFSESRKIGEYVLIGTLLSFVIAVIVGLVAGVLLAI